jgi:hypothetical protein
MRRLRRLSVAGLLVGGIPLALFALPVFPLRVADRWMGRVVAFAGVRAEDLTLEFHQEYGWKELVTAVERVYKNLGAADRARCTVLTHTYAQAGAIDLFGPHLGLPPARSGHMTCWLWGPGREPIEVLIACGIGAEKLETIYARVRRVATSVQPPAWGEDARLPVYLRSHPRRDLRAAWPQFKRFEFRSQPVWPTLRPNDERRNQPAAIRGSMGRPGSKNAAEPPPVRREGIRLRNMHPARGP